METFITHPAENGPFAPVIVYMDMWGVREELYDIARRIATVGYYCMLPDLYYRNGKIRNAFRNDAGRMLSFGKLDEASKRAVLAPMEALTDAMVVADTACLLDFIDRGEPVQHFPDARVSPGAPTAYIADDGAFVHPTTGEADAKLVDRDLAVYALKAGYGVRGASLGSQGDQAALFRDEMTRFFERTLLG